MKELILRIKAILKRTNPTSLDRVEYKDILLDIKPRKVYVAKEEIDLTKLEFDLLKTLIENRNNVLNREFLLTHVWKDETYFQDKTVNVAVNRLKKKIDPTGEKEYIKSVWGVGYTVS
jgi:DNA-binding response OmpR family regulator